MGFLMNCDNRKCGKSNEPMLDKETNDVICSECGEIIKNVTIFAKNSMKGMGQFKKAVKSQEAFSVPCNSCKKSACPKLDKGRLLCPNCNVEHTELTAPFAYSIKNHLASKKSI